MTLPSYTEEDVERLTQLIFNVNMEPRAHPQTIPADRYARAVLDFLAARNRLVPPGSEVREEWGTRGGDRNGDWNYGSRENAELCVRRQPTRQLISRRVITTPWSPSVPDTEEGISLNDLRCDDPTCPDANARPGMWHGHLPWAPAAPAVSEEER